MCNKSTNKQKQTWAYLGKKVLVTVRLLMQKVISLCVALKLRFGSFVPRLWRRGAPRTERTAHRDDYAQPVHVVKLTERR